MVASAANESLITDLGATPEILNGGWGLLVIPVVAEIEC